MSCYVMSSACRVSITAQMTVLRTGFKYMSFLGPYIGNTGYMYIAWGYSFWPKGITATMLQTGASMIVFITAGC